VVLVGLVSGGSILAVVWSLQHLDCSAALAQRAAVLGVGASVTLVGLLSLLKDGVSLASDWWKLVRSGEGSWVLAVVKLALLSVACVGPLLITSGPGICASPDTPPLTARSGVAPDYFMVHFPLADAGPDSGFGAGDSLGSAEAESLRRVLSALASCAEANGTAPVTVIIAAYADGNPFKTDSITSRDWNILLANRRAEVVDSVIEELRLGAKLSVLPVRWPSQHPEWMYAAKRYRVTRRLEVARDDEGLLNRRAEIGLLEAGRCGFVR